MGEVRRYMTLGILAHVDAGKTTLSESILYLSGKIRTLGRVDHQDAFLDTHTLERNRGITIFSKQAVLELGNTKVTLLDTPGHVDFSAEMERTLQVLDCAILVISGADGVQGHTRTLWKLLRRYQVPVFVFVNKMDQEGTDRDRLLGELKQSLSDGITAFDRMEEKQDLEEFYENIAMCDEAALESYLQEGALSDGKITELIHRRKVFPCYFGSALKLEGVKELLAGMERYTHWNPTGRVWGMEEPSCGKSKGEGFGARVFKISRDGQGNRLTHLKITNGVLHVKDLLQNSGEEAEKWEEKVNQIRIYSGEKYETVQQAETGDICAVTGLTHTYPGEGIGTERRAEAPKLEPVLNYRVLFPENVHVHTMLQHLRMLEEEDPMLRVVWDEELEEIHVQLMGEVQTEVLQSVMEERFGVRVSFDSGSIVYKETIQNTVEGVGHYEPLRHYAEVHLILEPGSPGSGLVFDTVCSEDVLDRNWQRLILTHLGEKRHRGVLIGAEITDMKITLAAGRAHLKHTEGGDFRQSTYRAVRQGLMQAESVLLEPYYEFRLTVPQEMVGRALTDIQRMYGEFAPPVTEGEFAVISGSAPVSEMRAYQREVISFTRGLGSLSLVFQGYAPCHNAQAVQQEVGYDPQGDMENPTGSVFCSHGAGFYVPWDQVPDHMHIASQLPRFLAGELEEEKDTEALTGRTSVSAGRRGASYGGSYDPEEEKELEEIFMRTYGKVESKRPGWRREIHASSGRTSGKQKENLREYLLVDGYNIIHAWEDLRELAKVNIEAARGKLMDILCNYQGFKRCTVILVFDAYNVEGDILEIQKYHNIHVVYTKEAETADQYIEKVVHEIGRKYHVTVATSDGVEQVVTLGQGGTLISAREFLEEIRYVEAAIREEARARRESVKTYLFDHVDEDLARKMEKVRLGEEESL